ncbi:hypothetical protein [Natronococcus wangiae]|uniref:hypothetical protein n=1 Tax=Natronococcus wangiae TaxID=3068275 RepID=UPI00273E4A9F|nr:hypothetical protein [Natronococcus sp. AD5]
MTEATSSGIVGPIIFANQIARNQLIEHGEVVTFRKSQRTTGDTWWRESRLGPKQGDVLVEEIGRVDPREVADLDQYLGLSGFESVSAWQTAMKDLNGSLPAQGYLYKVTQS